MVINPFVIFFASIFTSNVLLTNFLGMCSYLSLSKDLKSSFGLGQAVTFVMTLSSAVTYVVYHYILVRFNLEYLQTIAFILVIAALVQFIEMFLRKFVPALYNALGIFLPLITTNCAVLGSALLEVEKGYNFIYSVVFGLSAALGFTLAIVIFAGVRQRLELADCPKAFKGMPIALVTAGLIAMAFSGFTGMSLS